MAKKKKNVIRYRKPVHLNVGVVIFLVVAVYLGIFLLQYMAREKIRVYEVVEGSVTNTSQYTGIALRDEKVTYAQGAGYLNFYKREDERVRVGDLIYTLDESGTVSDILAQLTASSDSLTDDNLLMLKNQLANFSTDYQPVHFDDVYSIKASLSTSLLEYMSGTVLDELTEMLERNNIVFTRNYTDTSGIVEFYVDGMEELKTSDIDEVDFSPNAYTRTSLSSGSLVESGGAVFKTIHSDTWDIIIPISDEDKAKYSENSIISVAFPGTGLTANAEYDLVIGSDGEAYGRLHLYKYMVQFASDRFINVELEDHGEAGLKIPTSAVISKPFYIIPKSYMTTGGDSYDDGFFQEVYNAGTTSVEFTPTTIYYSDEEYCYVDPSAFTEGTVLIEPDTNNRYQVAATLSMQGVYNINKGYAVFRHIEIIDETGDYYIVKKNTSYGISLYDHIVLNAAAVKENDIVY